MRLELQQGSRFDRRRQKLYQHADNAESNGNQWHTTLTNNQFDYVILQDQSQVPSFPTTESYWQNSKNGAIRLTMIEQVLKPSSS